MPAMVPEEELLMGETIAPVMGDDEEWDVLPGGGGGDGTAPRRRGRLAHTVHSGGATPGSSEDSRRGRASGRASGDGWAGRSDDTGCFGRGLARGGLTELGIMTEMTKGPLIFKTKGKSKGAGLN